MKTGAVLHWVQPQTIGMPGLYAMAAGFALFFLALAFGRRGGGKDTGPQQRSAASIVGILIQMVGFTIVGFGPMVVGLDPGSPLALGEAAAVAALMLLATLLFLSAARAMGRNWSLVARTRSDHELITSGPFAAIRHPIYTALFAFMLALTIAFGHERGLILGLPLYWIGTWIRIAREEKLLRAQFGEAYDDYARRVKRFIPGLV